MTPLIWLKFLPPVDQATPTLLSYAILDFGRIRVVVVFQK
jgi:hypothetical protein